MVEKILEKVHEFIKKNWDKPEPIPKYNLMAVHMDERRDGIVECYVKCSILPRNLYDIRVEDGNYEIKVIEKPNLTSQNNML